MRCKGTPWLGEKTRFCRSMSICRRVALDPEEALEEFDSSARLAAGKEDPDNEGRSGAGNASRLAGLDSR